MLLVRMGCKVDIAGNGIEALEALEKQHYPVVLMDIQMPEMNGIEATQRVRTGFPVERQPYIIVMTAGVTPKEIQACEKAGMNDFVTKPVKIAELELALNKAVAIASGSA